MCSRMALPMHESDPTENKKAKRIFLEVFIWILYKMISGTDRRAKSKTTWNVIKVSLIILDDKHLTGSFCWPHLIRSYCTAAGLQ